MPKFDYDLIVIGGGAAGLTAATFAGQSAAKTLLIEKEKKLGGDCLHYGCVPSKSLIKSASVYNLIRNTTRYGLPPAAITPVDLGQVNKRIKGIIDTIQKHDEPQYLSQHFNVETRFGEARFVDPQSIELGDKKITARYFVIATGSSPAIPPIDGLNEIAYLTNMNIFQLDKLPQSLVVLGAGPIGLELAQSFARLGAKVTVVEAASHVLPREDEDVGKAIKAALEDEGIEFILNSSAQRIEKNHQGITLTVKHGQSGFSQVVEAERILVATGRRPNVYGMDLEKAGVKYSSRGIEVDEKLKTSASHVFACGDVNGKLPFTHVASYEAIVAIYNAILKVTKKADYRNMPWVTYTNPEVASIGYNEQRANEAGLKFSMRKILLSKNDRALAEGETLGFVKVLVSPKGKAIGVQIIGSHAGELIAEWIPILNGSISLSSMAEMVHPYPTLSEVNKAAMVDYVVSTVPSWTKRVLKIIFGYQGKI